MIHLTWGLLALMFGAGEAVHIHYKPNYWQTFKRKTGFDIHALLVVIRVVPFIVLGTLMYFKGGIVDLVYFFLFCIFVFPFLHDGMYYQTRKLLSNGKVYPDGWIDQSTSTSAKFSFGFFWRMVFFVLSFFML